MVERRLILVRHATAVSGANLPTDHERPLTPRGAEEAVAVGRRLVARGWHPERALVSDAARTQETWWCMAPALGDVPAAFLPSLYAAGIDAVAAVVKRVDPAVRTVLLLGHNPGWSDAATWLTGAPVRLAPAHAALMRGVSAEWADVLGAGGLELVDVLRPDG